MKKGFIGKAFVFILLTAAINIPPTSAMPITTRPVAEASWCQCVGFIVNALFDGVPRPGHWPSAASMATDAYWGDENVVGKGNLRYRSNTAQKDDVLIMQPEATVNVWNKKNNVWDLLSGDIGSGDGHIGFVIAAKYLNDYAINGVEKDGWRITLQSANWDDDNSFDNGSAYSIDLGWDTVSNCTNVNFSWIFVPNGDAVSFWRQD